MFSEVHKYVSLAALDKLLHVGSLVIHKSNTIKSIYLFLNVLNRNIYANFIILAILLRTLNLF